MSNQEQLLHNPAQIIGLLRRLQQAHTLVSLGCELGDFAKHSVIIDVQTDQGWMLLDAINDAPWHPHLQTGTIMHLTGKIDGIKTQCDCTFHSLISDSTTPFYRVYLPETMLYRQRRRHYRARVNLEKPLPISLPLSVKHNISGYIVDISASGVCSRIDFDAASALAIEQAIHRAHIKLPDKQTLTCDLALRSLRHFPEKGYSLIGGEFLHISPHQQNHVEKLVAQLDRNQRRSDDLI